MPFLNGKQVQQLLRTTASEGLTSSYALRCLVQSASYPPQYTADPRWSDAIISTAAGEELLRRVSSHPIPRSDLFLALFGLFWFQDPLVDASRSNLELIRELVIAEANQRRLCWPIIQGRLLYDRYAELFPDMRDTITAQEWTVLLRNSPQGVYQVGTPLTGPLGIVDSRCVRYFPPSRTVGLLHCPMLECRALHAVRLVPPRIPLVEAYRLLENAAIDLWTTSSRWKRALSSWPHSPEDAWRAFSGMPLFLGNCIVAEDRTTLLARVLASSDGDELRATLSRRLPGKTWRGEPAKIASLVDAETQLQLLLIVPDNTLKQFIDNLVWSGEIHVPAGEVREVEDERYAFCRVPFAHNLQLSSLGLRARRKHPVLLLRSLVWNAYVQSKEESDLDWRLRKAPEVSTQDALMDYFRVSAPPTAIETLVLTSPRVTKAVAQALDTEITAPDDRARAILLWKLGFDIPREERGRSTITRLLEEFANTVSRIGVPKGDDDRQAIRSAGVNAFVELEGFIDEMISYLVWLLCSDHPKVTRFVYSRTAALLSVPGVLGAELTSGGETVSWKATGNTLGACIRYLQQLANWMSTLPNSDRSSLLRASDELQDPESDSVTSFPFRYVQLWADANPNSLSKLAAVVESCSVSTNRGEVASIRNGLEHYREPHRFPASDRILSAIAAVGDFVSLAQKERLRPRMFWFAGSTTDSFRQSTFTLIDNRGDTFQLHAPLTVRGSPYIRDLPTSKPVLIAPGNLFGLPNADLLLGIRPESVYSRYWADYPLQRQDSVFTPVEDVEAPSRAPQLPGEAAQPGTGADAQ